MTKPKSRPLVVRKKATDATLEKFGGRPFALGSVDCGKMTAFHLRQLGHKVRLSKAGQYKTALGAKAALRRMGYNTLAEAMDGLGFERIAPASALVGDVISLPAEHDLWGLGIWLGNANALAFHEGHDGLVVLTPTADALRDAIAWRVYK